MKNNYLKLSFLLVLISFLIHTYLASSHYSFKYGIGSEKSICSINETLNCEAVSISQYSYFLGKPLATWGLSFHLAFLLLFFFLLRTSGQDRSVRFIRSMALISLISSVVMATISLTQMDIYCLFCMILYVISIANFILLLVNGNTPIFVTIEDIKSLFQSGEFGFRNFLFLLLGIPVLTFLADDMWKKNYGNTTQFLQQDGINLWEKSPEYNFSKPLLVKGDPTTATFRIIEFADFMCIHCKHAVHTLDSFMNSHPNVSIEFYAFPLDSQCNPAVGSGNGQRCQLAKAVYCAELQTYGWKAHKWIFDRFGTSEQFKFEQLKTDLNLATNAFDTCMNSEEASKAILENAKVGQEAKVDSTPAIYVNNKKLGFGNTIPVLEALYKKLNTK